MFMQWTNLVCGYSQKEPINLPFSGTIDKVGIYTIEGPNGSGKSTLLRTWIGLLPPLSGQVTLRHADCRHSPTNFPCIGYVPQNSNINPYYHISVRNMIKQGLIRLGRNPDKQDLNDLEELIKNWDLTSVADKSFHEISMGQKTRALIVRALISKPNLIFLDEPLASLDADCQLFVIDMLKNLQNTQETCVILIDHHLPDLSKNLSGSFFIERLHYKNVCSISYKAYNS